MQDDKAFQERLQRVETFLETEDGYIGLSVSSQYFGAVAGVPTAPHRARSETGPSPQVFEKIRLE